MIGVCIPRAASVSLSKMLRSIGARVASIIGSLPTSVLYTPGTNPESMYLTTLFGLNHGPYHARASLILRPSPYSLRMSSTSLCSKSNSPPNPQEKMCLLSTPYTGAWPSKTILADMTTANPKERLWLTLRTCCSMISRNFSTLSRSIDDSGIITGSSQSSMRTTTLLP